jgi:DNA-binding SARP family transcriptional activator
MLSLLGPFRLTYHNQPLPIGSGSKSEAILVHLALASHRCLPRAQLLEQLWPDHDPTLAGQSLNSLLYQLNRLLKKAPRSVPIVLHENGYYALNYPAEVSVDMDYFEALQQQGKQLLNDGQIAGGIAYCEEALALYRGDLCCDANIQAILERERLRVLFLSLLAALVDHYDAYGDPARALTYIQRLLKHDPCREDAHRQAMRCYVCLGMRAQALRQYQLCCQLLATEFDAKPEPATDALFEQIRLNRVDITPLA